MAFGKGHVLVQMEHLYLAPGNVKADEASRVSNWEAPVDSTRRACPWRLTAHLKERQLHWLPVPQLLGVEDTWIIMLIINFSFIKILCVFITFLFCGIVITACGKPKEIKYCNSTSLFGASLSEACELLGIEVDSENYSEAMLAGHNYKIYTPEELYTINGYETSVALYIHSCRPRMDRK